MLSTIKYCALLVCLIHATSHAQIAKENEVEGNKNVYFNSTLIVDEKPGRIYGNEDYPPGRLVHYAESGDVIFETNMLKMPHDAVRMDDGSYWVGLIREKALWRISPNNETLAVINVGGYPCALEVLENGNILVAGWDDDMPGFVKEFTQSGDIVWQMLDLKWPWKAQRLENGNTLIADAGLNRVYEVDAQKQEVWAVENLGPEENELFDSLGPVYVQRIVNGNTLVSIMATNRIVEVDPSGTIVWELGDEIVNSPYSAIRLKNGNTLIADGGHHRVIEVDTDKNIVWEKDGFGFPAKAYREE
jgi:uncharacterized protein (UPF0248 family)